MALSAGERLGPYEIVAPIGKGGMGEVYRARDTKLKREVAMKVLPEAFAADPGRLARFQREAEVLASLNHPNIAHIYEVEDRALIMELVEGESPKGPMPLEDAWKIALQIADALQYAHDKGVIHRDLKPANVKVTPEGVVKLLDFGLAKAFSGTPDQTASDPSNSPTITLGATAAGTVLGTAAYMSPEQARGRNVDKRADIWSWGVVFYELLTGKRLFAGDSAADTLAAVIHRDPDLSAVPEKARLVLAACLEKDPNKRLRDIGDARRLLVEPAASAPAPTASRFKWGWATAGVLGLAAAALSFIHFREVPPAADVQRFTVNMPSSAVPNFLAISPDGRKLAIGTNFLGKTTMFVRAMDSAEAVSLDGTELARSPFWSPDSRFIGFFVSGKLKTIPAAGGPATTLCGDTEFAEGGAWNRAGVILFVDDVKLRRVNAAGGECAPVNIPELTSAQFPKFLPDGNHFLFVGAKAGDANSPGVYLGSLEGMKPRKIVNATSSGLYSPSATGRGPAYVLFLRGTNLMAQPFDPNKLEAIGDPLAVPAPASQSGSPPEVAASVSSDGTLVYLNGVRVRQQLTWFDRSGNEIGKLGQPSNRRGVSLSPDGTRAVSADAGVRMYDLVRHTDSGIARPGSGGVWSPDGTRVIFTRAEGGRANMFLKPVDGGEPERRLFPPDNKERYVSDWSRDGKYVIYTAADEKDQGDIWYLTNPGRPGSKEVRFVSTPGIDTHGQLSPDGRWMAYYSTEGNSGNLYLRAFPSGDRGVKVAELGWEPHWSKSGNELFYLTRGALGGHAALMSISFHDAGAAPPKLGPPQKIVEFPAYIYLPQINYFSYSVHPDGKRFLVNVDAPEEKREINVITNWEKLLPSGGNK